MPIVRPIISLTIAASFLGCGAPTDYSGDDTAGKADGPLSTQHPAFRSGETVSGRFEGQKHLTSYSLVMRRGDVVQLAVTNNSAPIRIELFRALRFDLGRDAGATAFTCPQTGEYGVFIEQAERQHTNYTLHAQCLAGPCLDDPTWTAWRDDFEPNDTREAAALTIGGDRVSDNDHVDYHMVGFDYAALDPGDVDWYKVPVKDHGNFSNPSVMFGVVTKGGTSDWKQLNVRVYYQCNSGTTSLSCTYGEVLRDSEGNTIGCGATGPEVIARRDNEQPELILVPSCSGTSDESGHALVEVSPVAPLSARVYYNLKAHNIPPFQIR